MRGRDLLILAPVVLIAGIAIADALRGGGSSTVLTTESERTTTRSVVTETELPEDLGRGSFPPIAGAGGSVVFTQPGECPVREVDLGTGIEAPNLVRRSSCDLWAAPVTYKVAVGLRAARNDSVPFLFRDLARGGRNLGTSEAYLGFLLWSEDGQRAAWCNSRRVGIDYDVGTSRHALPGCPAAYTPDAEVALAEGPRLVVEGRTELEVSGTITFADYGSDGSIAVLVEGERLERWQGGRLRQTFRLPQVLVGRTPILSPDNCSALFRRAESVRLVDVGCSPYRPNSFPGTTASWSPNGDWIVAAGPDEIAFHDLAEGGEPVTWPLGAVQIYWRRS
jgi:hypothetical protein